MFIHKLFALMKEKGASDLFISAGSAIHLKINGEALPINPQVIDRIGQGHVGAGDRRRAGAAVGLDDVAIERDGAIAEQFEINH